MATLLTLVGCSFGVARIPKHPARSYYPERERFECGIVAAPIVDTVAAVGLGTFVMNREFGYVPDPMEDPYTMVLGTLVEGAEYTIENGLLGTAAAAFFASAVYGYVQSIRCHESQRRFESGRMRRVAERRALAARREEANRLTKRSALAARNGDCAEVRRLAVDIERLDREFYEVVFARDAAIVRCLEIP